MKTRVVNLHHDHYDVYIGRAGKGQNGYFGNPFPPADESEAAREESVHRFEEYFYDRIEKDLQFKTAVFALKGRRLGCFCAPKLCHGHIIADYLENEVK